jgi:hypothetical protein
MNHYDQLTAEEANEVDAVAARWGSHHDKGFKNELARLLLTTIPEWRRSATPSHS